jgi:hypothetical protein
VADDRLFRASALCGAVWRRPTGVRANDRLVRAIGPAPRRLVNRSSTSPAVARPRGARLVGRSVVRRPPTRLLPHRPDSLNRGAARIEPQAPFLQRPRRTARPKPSGADWPTLSAEACNRCSRRFGVCSSAVAAPERIDSIADLQSGRIACIVTIEARPTVRISRRHDATNPRAPHDGASASLAES